MSTYKSNVRMLAARRMALRVSVGVTAAVAFAGTGVLPALAQTPAVPSGPVTINIVDVAGDLALTQDAFELYAKKNPTRVSRFVFTKAPAPELPGKLKAMQSAGRSDIDSRSHALEEAISAVPETVLASCG